MTVYCPRCGQGVEVQPEVQKVLPTRGWLSVTWESRNLQHDCPKEPK